MDPIIVVVMVVVLVGGVGVALAWWRLSQREGRPAGRGGERDEHVVVVRTDENGKR